MRAIRVHEFGGPGVLRAEEAPDPSPGAGEVLVRLAAAGVNPVDTYIRAGSYGARDFPFIPGLDGAGTVEALGEGVGGLRAGDGVFVASRGAGTYAELCVCPAAQVHRLPDGLSPEAGACVGVPYGTAWRALFQRAGARPGETVLVYGASGGVGTAAVQMARAWGMRVLGTAGSEAGRELVLEQGAHQVFDHGRAGYEDEIVRATDGRGVDVVLEMLADVNLSRDLAMIASRGRVVVIGSRGRIDFEPRATMRAEADVRGMALFNVSGDEYREIYRGVSAGLAGGVLRPVVREVMALEDAARAHEAFMAPGARGQIVLRIG